MQPDVSYFDAAGEYSVLDRRLPHWAQAGTFTFVTFRLHDSIPAKVAQHWKSERVRILTEAGVDPNKSLTDSLAKLPKRQASLLRWKLFQAWDAKLDEAHGESCLRDPCASKIVADGLLKFDGERYLMAAATVMPNHVHLLAAFATDEDLTRQGTCWRQFMAREINGQLQRSGHLWQQDQFDHLVRSPESFDRIRNYIIDNPRKAKLIAGEYRSYISSDW